MLQKIIDFLFQYHILWMASAYLAGRGDYLLALIMLFVAWVIEDYLIGLVSSDPDVPTLEHILEGK